MKPLKHKDLIIAWAGGADIQSFNPSTNTWEPDLNPTWHP